MNKKEELVCIYRTIIIHINIKYYGTVTINTIQVSMNSKMYQTQYDLISAQKFHNKLNCQ